MDFGLLIEEALTGEPNQKEPTLNKEPSTDNDEVTALELTPPPNDTGAFHDIGGYIFDYAKEGVLVGKTDLEPILNEGGFGAATEMGGSTLEKGSKVSLVPEHFWTYIFT